MYGKTPRGRDPKTIIRIRLHSPIQAKKHPRQHSTRHKCTLQSDNCWRGGYTRALTHTYYLTGTLPWYRYSVFIHLNREPPLDYVVRCAESRHSLGPDKVLRIFYRVLYNTPIVQGVFSVYTSIILKSSAFYIKNDH